MKLILIEEPINILLLDPNLVCCKEGNCFRAKAISSELVHIWIRGMEAWVLEVCPTLTRLSP